MRAPAWRPCPARGCRLVRVHRAEPRAARAAAWRHTHRRAACAGARPATWSRRQAWQARPRRCRWALRALAQPAKDAAEAVGGDAGGPAAAPPPPPAAGDGEHSRAQQRARQRRLWLAAAKPPMYSVAVVPILVSARRAPRARPAGRGRVQNPGRRVQVGSGAAYAATGALYAARCGQLLLGSILVVAWLNLRCGARARALATPPRRAAR